MRRTYANAGMQHSMVNGLQLHGTGTPLGDPIVSPLALLMCVCVCVCVCACVYVCVCISVCMKHRAAEDLSVGVPVGRCPLSLWH